MPTKCKTRKWRGLLPAVVAVFLILNISSVARAQSEECVVSFSVDNSTFMRALQIEVNHQASAGGFVIGGCTVQPGGIVSVTENNISDLLDVAWADTVGFTGPAAFVSCTYVSTGGAAPLPTDFVVTVTDSSGANPPAPANPVPSVSATVGTCTPSVVACGNGVTEAGEVCDGVGCNSSCQATTGSCPASPATGCRQVITAGKAKIKIKNDVKNPGDNTKDQGQFDWKKGAATSGFDFKDPVNGSASYRWCVYDATGLISGHDVAAGGTCGGKPCWKRSGKPDAPKGFKYGNKNGNASGVTQLKFKAGADTKAQVSIKAKNKKGAAVNFAAAALPVVEPVVSQIVIDDSGQTVCFETVFDGTDPKKNKDKQYSAKGP